MIGKRDVPPESTGLLDLAMDAGALTEYPADFLIDGRKHFIFQAITDVVFNTATVGDSSIRLDMFAKDKTTLIYSLDLATALRTHTANDRNVILFGAGAASAIFGNGTLGTDLAVLKIIFWFQPVVVIGVNADQAATMSVRFLMEG